MMNTTEHLLTCLMEECAEVQQRASKALRFGLNEIEPGQKYTNAERIMAELVDVQAVVEMLIEAGALVEVLELEPIERKQHKVEKFMQYAREQGTLTD